jgi:hypothetical protein
MSTLLDSGCENSVIARRLIPEAVLSHTSRRLFAANGTQIPLLGQTTIKFRVGNSEMSAEVVVTDAVDELILGIDWMSENKCRWDFGKSVIGFNGKSIQLHSRPAAGAVRRIYAENDVIIPAGHHTNVPVNVAWPDLRPMSGNWAVEAKSINQGILAARTLINENAFSSAVQVMNISKQDFVLRKGRCIGGAVPVTVCVLG